MYNKKVLIDAVRNLSKTKNSTNTNNGLDNNFKRGGSNKRPSLPKGKSPKSYSRSFEATNRLFAENPLFKKPKSRKNKIFDPRAQYYANGGEPCFPGYIRDENGDCVWHDPDQENLVISDSPIQPVEYLRSQLTTGDPFYNTHEVRATDEGEIKWEPKADIEQNLRNTDLRKFIQRHPDEATGLELGYLHNNIWTTPSLGLEKDTIEPGYAPNQLSFERDGQHPNVYFIKNTIKGSEEAPSYTYQKAFGEKYGNQYLNKRNEYNQASNEIGQDLLKKGYKGENMWGKDDPDQLYQLYGTEGLKLKGTAKVTPETLKYLESIKDSEEGKRYLAKIAGISEDDPDYADMLMHYNTTPIDVYAKSSRPNYEDIPKAQRESDNTKETSLLTDRTGPVNYANGGLTQYEPGGYSDEPPGSKKKNYGDSKRILPRWMPKGMVKAIQNTEVGISPYMTNEQAYPIGMKQNLTDFASGKSLLGEGTKAIGMSNPSYGVNFTTGLTRDISKNKDSGWALKGYLGKPYDPSMGQAVGQAIQKMGKDQYEGAWERYYDDLATYNAGEMSGSAYREGPDKWDPEKEKPKESVGKFLKGFGKAVEKSPVVGGLSAHYRYDKFKQPHGYKAAGEGEIKLDWDPSNNIGLGLKGGLEFYGGDKYHSKNYRPGSYKWNVNPSVTAGIGTRPHFGFNLNAGVEGLPKFMPKNFPGYFYGNVNYNQSLMLPGSFSANAGMMFPLNQYKQRKAQKQIDEKIKNDPFIPSNNNVRNTTFGSQKNGGISINLTEDEIQKYVDGGYIVEDDISIPQLNQYAPGGWPPKGLRKSRKPTVPNEPRTNKITITNPKDPATNLSAAQAIKAVQDRTVNLWNSAEGQRRLQNVIDTTPALKANLFFDSKDMVSDLANTRNLNQEAIVYRKTLDDIIAEQNKIDSYYDQNLMSDNDYFNTSVSLDNQLKTAEENYAKLLQDSNTQGGAFYDRNENAFVINPKFFTNEELPSVGMHEILHQPGLKRGTGLTSLDVKLGDLDLKNQLDFDLSNTSNNNIFYKHLNKDGNYLQNAISYYNLNGGFERSPFLAELRENMLQNNIIKHPYQKVNSKMIKDYYKDYLKKEDKFPLRIFDIMTNKPKNFSLLSNTMNELPSWAPYAIGAGTATLLSNPFSAESNLEDNKYDDGGESCPEGYIRNTNTGKCVLDVSAEQIPAEEWYKNWYANRVIQDEEGQKLLNEARPKLLKRTEKFPEIEYDTEGLDDSSGMYNPMTGKISLNSSQVTSPFIRDEVLFHERGHYLTSPSKLDPEMDTYKKMKNHPIHKLREYETGFVNQALVPKNKVSKEEGKFYDYISGNYGEEMSKRIMELRRLAGFKPDQVITDDDLKNFYQKAKTKGWTNPDSDAFVPALIDFQRFINSPQDLKMLLNKMAKNEPEQVDEFQPQQAQYGGTPDYQLGDEIDKATMEKLKKLGYTFEKI